MVDVSVKKLFREMDAAVAQYLPRFQHVAGEDLPGASRVYHWKREDGLDTYIQFLKFKIRNRITVDAAWTTKHRYPSHLTPLAVRPVPHAEIPIDDPIEGEFQFRVSDLWEPGKDLSWRVAVNNYDRVYEVAQQLADHLVPYFEQVDPTKPGGWS